MRTDPIVDEVRAFREAHAKEFNFDLSAIYADLKRREEEEQRQVVSFQPRPVSAVPAGTHRRYPTTL